MDWKAENMVQFNCKAHSDVVRVCGSDGKPEKVLTGKIPMVSLRRGQRSMYLIFQE